MKKFVATILACVLALSLCSVSWADDAKVAKIGDTEYATLQAAVNAVADGETITLLGNVTDGIGVTVPSGKNFTIDFAGYTYTVTQAPAGSTGTENQCFQLLKDSTITMKNGTITANTVKVKMIIQNYCNLTLDNMKLDATQGTNSVQYVMSNNCGNVSITNGTVITAKDTGVAFDVYGGFGNYGDVNVTVSGGSVINGKVEVARGSGDQNKNTLTVENSTINGALDITDNAKTSVTVKSGTFAGNVDTKYVAADTPAASAESNGSTSFVVGSSAIASAANSGAKVTVKKGGAITGINPGVKVDVDASVTGTVKINDTNVEPGKSYYRAPASSGSYTPAGKTFTTDLPAGSITAVYVNGSKLDSKYYSVSGSNVTLLQSYLDTLKAGKYTVKIENATHVSTGTFTVAASGTSSSPKTFDAGIALYVGMALTSVTGMAYVGKKKF